MGKNVWSSQQEANLVAFMDDDEYRKRKDFFFKMLKAFEKEGIKWNLFCSSSLFFLGITDDFHDFDLLIDKDSMESAKTVLKELGMKIQREEMYGFEIDENDFSPEELRALAKLMFKASKGKFVSDRYLDLASDDGVEVDVISGFRVGAMNTQYLYEYSEDRIEFVEIQGMKVPVVCPEAQFILYAMMECWQPQRKFKRRLLKDFIEERGVHYPEVLEEALKERIPSWIKTKIREILS